MSIYRKPPAALSVAPPAPWWRVLLEPVSLETERSAFALVVCVVAALLVVDALLTFALVVIP